MFLHMIHKGLTLPMNLDALFVQTVVNMSGMQILSEPTVKLSFNKMLQD